MGSFSDGELVRVRGLLTKHGRAALVTVSSGDAGSDIAACSSVMRQNGADLRVDGKKALWGASMAHHTQKLYEIGTIHHAPRHNVAAIRAGVPFVLSHFGASGLGLASSSV